MVNPNSAAQSGGRCPITSRIYYDQLIAPDRRTSGAHSAPQRNDEATMEFQKAFKEFLQFCSVERRQSEHTISAYRLDLLDFRKWIPVEKGREDITEEDMSLYLEDMVSKRQLSVATVRRRLACLRGFFRRQAEFGLYKDPCGSWRPKL